MPPQEQQVPVPQQRSYVLIIGVPTLLLLVGVYAYMKYFQTQIPIMSVMVEQKQSQTSQPTPTISIIDVATSTPSNLVTLFAVADSGTTTSEREWTTYAIWRKVGNHKSEVLATVGAVGEFAYPSTMQLSPDHHYLAIGLESKLDVLDLVTGSLKTIFLPKSVVGNGVAFSPDSTHVAVSDGSEYTPPENGSALYSVDVRSGERTALYTSSTTQEFAEAVAWRSDGNIILSYRVPKGSGPTIYTYFSPVDNQLHQLGSSPVLDHPSSSGKYFVMARAIAADPCQQGEMGASDAATGISMVDPIASTTVVSYVPANEIVDHIEYSPDETHILFGTHSVSACKTDTKQQMIEQYWTLPIVANAQPTRVVSVDEVHTQWKKPNIQIMNGGIVDPPAWTNNEWGLAYDGKPLVLAKSSVSPIGSFFVQ